MTQRLYMVPIIRIDLPGGSFYNVPKYFPHRTNPNSLPELAGVQYTWETMIEEEAALLVADVTDAQHTLITSQPDITAIPPLDNTIPNASVRNAVRNALETLHLPGTWVQTGMSYRSIIRVVLGVFQYFGRFKVLYYNATGVNRLFDGSINLDLTVSQLSQPVVSAMTQAAIDMGLDYSGVTGSTTLREVLRLMGAQYINREFDIGGFVI